MSDLLPDQSDDDLLDLVRNGDLEAASEIFSRHHLAVRNLAFRWEKNPTQVDDLVSEAFARLVEQLTAGKGPKYGIRQYLYVTMRNIVTDTLRVSSPTHAVSDIDDYLPAAEGADEQGERTWENAIVAEAFTGLPDRWQEVLWYGSVEGLKPRELSPILGMAPNACSALLLRAREGFSRAYLEARIASDLPDECKTNAPALADLATQRGGTHRAKRMTPHMRSCEHCSLALAHSSDITSTLRTVIAPLTVGSSALAAALWPSHQASALATLVAFPATKVAAGLLVAAVVATGTLIMLYEPPVEQTAVLPPLGPGTSSAEDEPVPAASSAPSAPMGEVAIDSTATATPTPSATPSAKPGDPADPPASGSGAPAQPAAPAAPAPTVGFSLSAPSAIEQKTSDSIVVTITNTGATTAASVSFSIGLNSEGSFSRGAAQWTGSHPWSCSASGATARCSANNLGPGATASIYIPVVADGYPGNSISAQLSPSVSGVSAAGSSASSTIVWPR